MVDGDSMGPGLQVLGARFSNFLLGKLSREFKLRRQNADKSRKSNGHISVVCEAAVRWLGTLVVLLSYTCCVCLYDLVPIQGHGQDQGQGHGVSKFLKIVTVIARRPQMLAAMSVSPIAGHFITTIPTLSFRYTISGFSQSCAPKSRFCQNLSNLVLSV